MMLRPEDCIPGTLVECTDDTPRAFEFIPVKRGRIYTVVGLAEFSPADGDVGVLLREALAAFPELGFWRDRFRLLPDERLSIFRQMLAPAPKQKERV